MPYAGTVSVPDFQIVATPQHMPMMPVRRKPVISLFSGVLGLELGMHCAVQPVAVVSSSVIEFNLYFVMPH